MSTKVIGVNLKINSAGLKSWQGCAVSLPFWTFAISSIVFKPGFLLSRYLSDIFLDFYANHSKGFFKMFSSDHWQHPIAINKRYILRFKFRGKMRKECGIGELAYLLNHF